MFDINSILEYKNVMYRLALRITLNSQEAEDVVQDVIIKLWKMRERLDFPQSSPSGREIDNLQAFVLRMTRNLAIDRQRMHVNQTESLDVSPELGERSEAPSVEHKIESDERIQTIRHVMAKMPEKLRTAMQLRDFEGHSYKEIAEAMDVTEDNVKVYIFRARQFVKSNINIER